MTSRYGEIYDQWRADPQAFWARGGARDRLDPAAGADFRSRRRRLRPLVPRRAVQRLLQRARPPRRGRPRRTGRASSTTARSPATKRRITYRELLDETATLAAVLAGFRRRGGRPGAHLYADDPRSGRRDARLRAHRRGPFGRVRRLRGQGAGDPHRRRRAESHPDRVLRHRAWPHRRIQAAARSRDRPRQAQAGVVRRFPAPADRGEDQRGRDHDWKTLVAAAKAAGKRAACVELAATDPLYILYTSGTTGVPKGRGARHRRLHRRAQMVDVEDLRRQARRDLLDGVRHRLGRRPFLHRLRAAAAWLRQRAL